MRIGQISRFVAASFKAEGCTTFSLSNSFGEKASVVPNDADSLFGVLLLREKKSLSRKLNTRKYRPEAVQQPDRRERQHSFDAKPS